MPSATVDESPPASAPETHTVVVGLVATPPHDDTPTSSHDSNSILKSTESRDDDLRCPIHGKDDDCGKQRLGEKQREEFSARLLDPIEISFNKTSEALRASTQGTSNILPPFLYRTFYETSITLSSRVSKDTHVKHRERQKLKIRKGNAFQAVENVDVRRELTKPRIERHLVWDKKRDPSSFISVFNDLDPAQRRADFHYSIGQRIGHRVSVAEISTADLVPATVSGICETTWKVFTKVRPGEFLNSTVTTRPADLPVWISARLKPADGSSITIDEFEAADAELWLSITELRMSNLKDQPHGHDRHRMLFADGHDYEWLALGRIPESRIKRIMPWDGQILHESPGVETIYSKFSAEPWIYDRDIESWRLDPELFAQAKYPKTHNTCKSRKRQRLIDSDDTGPFIEVHGTKKLCPSTSQVLGDYNGTAALGTSTPKCNIRH